jgi:hypothetical protein
MVQVMNAQLTWTTTRPDSQFQSSFHTTALTLAPLSSLLGNAAMRVSTSRARRTISATNVSIAAGGQWRSIQVLKCLGQSKSGRGRGRVHVQVYERPAHLSCASDPQHQVRHCSAKSQSAHTHPTHFCSPASASPASCAAWWGSQRSSAQTASGG